MIAATIPVITFAQKTELTLENAPAKDKHVVVNTNLTDDENSANTNTLSQATRPGESNVPTEVKVEIQNYFNELRREFLDNRADTIDWWLAIIAIVLTIFGIVVPIAGYLGFLRFRKIEIEAKNSANAAAEHAENAKRHMEDIERNRDKSEKIIREMSAQSIAENPDEARWNIEDASNPEASLINKAIGLANSLQQQGKISEAIEKWRAVANISEGHDNDLSATAWFSVGYLLMDDDQELVITAYDHAIRLKSNYPEAYNNRGNAKYYVNQFNTAITDYDEAIRLKPDYPEAYFNRGNAKYMLRTYDVAIADYDEAIRLKPDYFEAFYNRGNVKYMLGQYDDAIPDYDEVIRLKQIYPLAYFYRGTSKTMMGRNNKARLDLETSLIQAREIGDTNLVAQVEQSLRNLDTDSGS